jgi:methionyl-tRNA synthetase
MKQEGQREQVSSDLYAVLEAARFVAQLLAPLVPLMSARMLAQLPAAPAPWPEQLRWGGLTVGAPLPEPTPVMARLELEGQL